MSKKTKKANKKKVLDKKKAKMKKGGGEDVEQSRANTRAEIDAVGTPGDYGTNLV